MMWIERLTSARLAVQFASSCLASKTQLGKSYASTAFLAKWWRPCIPRDFPCPGRTRTIRFSCPTPSRRRNSRALRGWTTSCARPCHKIWSRWRDRKQPLYSVIAIASVSLIVGGIGIMNVMLVSVTERTREIGVRVAVGATEGAIQLQFLAESLVLSLIGGAAGVLFGIFGSYLVGQTLNWPIEMSLEAVLVAAMFSVAVGIFFGYYPARKASLLDPIEALRYE